MSGQTMKKQAGRVLVVDDDVNICFTVKKYLTSMTYEVETANTGPAGLARALEGNFDAVILDVLLPGMDGFEVLNQLRKRSGVPVIMLTTRGELTDKVVGLEIGADDYMDKMFEPRELLARLRAVIRGRGLGSETPRGAEQPAEMRFGPLRIHPASREASLNGAAMELTPIEFKLLLTLAEAPGRAITREQLLEAVAPREYDVFDRSIDMHISSLRKKLGDKPNAPRFIRTIRSLGYLFIPSPGKGAA